MVLRLAAGLAIVPLLGSAAFACTGQTIFADNFQTADPAWHGDLAVSGGRATLTAPPGWSDVAFYGGKVVDSGNACVDVTAPTLKNGKAHGGLVFGFTDIDNFYAFTVGEDGQAHVFEKQNGGWLDPVTLRPAPGLRKGGNVANTLRVTWKGTSVSTYVNGRRFVSFTLRQPLQNSFVGLYDGNDAPLPTTYQFNNLKVTAIP